MTVVEAPAATREPLLAVHPDGYLRGLEAMSRRGGGALFLDTILNEASWRAALGATGAVLAAVDHAHAGRGHAFAAVRPPGHHALAVQGDGVLPGEQRGHRRAARPAGRPRAGADR